MTNNEIKTGLIAIFNALNNITVKGMDNVSNMAGIMQITKVLVEGITVDDESNTTEPQGA